MRTLSVSLWMTVVIAAAGCGGGEVAAPEPVETAGGDSTAAEGAEAEDGAGDLEEAESPEAEPAPVASGPATVTFKLTVAGDEIPGSVKVRADDNSILVEGKAGQPLEVPSGVYRTEVQADASGLVDAPTKWFELNVVPGDNPVAEVRFPWAKVRLDVKINGKPAKGHVDLLRRGDLVVTLPIAAAEHVLISPGRYQGKVKTRNAEIEVSQIVIPEGATRNVPIDVSW